MSKFKLIDEYMFSRLGGQNIYKRLTIIETEKRHSCEMSYGYISMIWIVKFSDDSVLASIPLNFSEKIKSFLYDNIEKYDITDDLFISQLKELADIEAKDLFDKSPCRCFNSLIFACNSETISPKNTNIKTIKITDKSFKCCDDIHFPEHCLPDGIIYTVIENNKIVSLAHAHKTGKYQDIVADIGIDTSKDYRRKGYARECVNSVARYVIDKGGESIYICSPDNTASIHTAVSAGYKLYGKSLTFSVIPE